MFCSRKLKGGLEDDLMETMMHIKMGFSFPFRERKTQKERESEKKGKGVDPS